MLLECSQWFVFSLMQGSLNSKCQLRAQGLFEVIIDDAKSKLTLLSEKSRVNYVIVGRIVMIISFK